MVNLRNRSIRIFLSLQKRVQRHASITFARRLTKWGEQLYSIPRDVRCEKVIRGELTYEWLIPPDVATERVIFFLHGGFVFPLTNPTRYLASYLAKLAQMRVLLVDFRLAPENPFPAAVEDCAAAYRWLISDGGVFPEQVSFVGESAGGNLAVTALLLLRDAGVALPNQAVLISPVVDFEGGGSFYLQNDPMADAKFVMLQLNAYRGSANPRNPLLAPIHANLQGLPPLLIQVGAEELLRSGAVELAERAENAGVPTTLEIWPGMWHYWHIFVNSLPEAQQAMLNINDFLQSCSE